MHKFMPSMAGKIKRGLGAEIKQLLLKKALDKHGPKSVSCTEIMKNSPIITVLVTAACVLGFVALGLSVLFELRFRELRRVQPMVMQTQNGRNLVTALANDALEYSKTHPGIDSILAQVGVKPPRPSGAPGTPASKPGTK